jgi:uncharacterized damage-inducible protein DinB
MKTTTAFLNRRIFLQRSAFIGTGLIGMGAFSHPVMARDMTVEESLYIIGPLEGYSPHIGTLVSMLNYNRQTVINSVKSLRMEQVDHLHDAKANTIAALVMHLGAVDKFYQINTFEGRQEFNDGEKKIWEAPMSLGDKGRKNIKGQEIKYYLDMIAEVRQKTLEEFKKKDDAWLLAIDPEWSKQRPLNTYWKWFHVCEHEANHRGQITWLKGRLPGAKESGD